MKDNQLLRKFISNLSNFIPKKQFYPKEHSSVALILRLADENDEIKQIDDINNLNNVQYENTYLEMFYILRAVRENDQWSNHVGFPGGMKEDGETYYDTAIREVQEEVDIDLNNKSNFQFLGELECQPMENGRNLIIHPYVFLQLSKVKFTPDPKEVQDFRWVPMQYFLNPNHTNKYLKMFWFPIFPIFNTVLKKDIVKEGDKTGLMTVALPTLHQFLNIKNETFPFKYQLWGLSLRMTHDLLEINEYPKICEEKYFCDNFLVEMMLNQKRESLQNSRL
eukprot:gene10324-2740_t